jgi:hypothetical protein
MTDFDFEGDWMTLTKDKNKNAGGLKGRLEDYSSSARAGGATRATLRQHLGNWPIYAAATGSAMAMATSASADTIIAYAGPPLTINAPGFSNASTSVRIGIAPRFTIFVSHEPLRGYASAFIQLGSELEAINGEPKNLAFGAAISDAAGPFSSTHRLLSNWLPNVPGFEGFRFETGLGQFDYGWAELKVGVDGSGFPDSVTLLGLAYDSVPGAAIAAGDSGPTPEPGTAGLMLLALGAAGVTLLRKRKA